MKISDLYRHVKFTSCATEPKEDKCYVVNWALIEIEIKRAEDKRVEGILCTII
jgi:hypothetical protein